MRGNHRFVILGLVLGISLMPQSVKAATSPGPPRGTLVVSTSTRRPQWPTVWSTSAPNTSPAVVAARELFALREGSQADPPSRTSTRSMPRPARRSDSTAFPTTSTRSRPSSWTAGSTPGPTWASWPCSSRS